jgi:hypothetical protein
MLGTSLRESLILQIPRVKARYVSAMAGFVELTHQRVNVRQFVSYWRQFYNDDDKVYFDNINVGADLTTDNLIALLNWKAQGRFKLAENFARAITPATLNDFRPHHPITNQDVEALFGSVVEQLQNKGLARSQPLIWPVFLCHLAEPESIPMYDVNAWIAWGWIDGWIESKYYKRQPTKLATYLDFRTWFNNLVLTHSLDPRELDRALMAFGRFLLSPWGVPFR